MSEDTIKSLDGKVNAQPPPAESTKEPDKLDHTSQPLIPEPPSKRQKTSHNDGESTLSSKEHVQQALAHARSKISLLVNELQLKNPMLKFIRHVRKEVHQGLSADFVCGPTTCALYLSLQYHKLHPSYIYTRVRSLGKHFRLRVLLLFADVADHSASVHELSRLALIENLTLVCAGSEREAARYLETLRSYDNKGTESIQERVGDDYSSRLNAALSSIRGVNRTDVSTLAFTFGSLRSLSLASEDKLRQCPGLGERKVSRLFTALHQPFVTDVPWTGIVEEQDDNALMDEDSNLG